MHEYQSVREEREADDRHVLQVQLSPKVETRTDLNKQEQLCSMTCGRE